MKRQLITGIAAAAALLAASIGLSNTPAAAVGVLDNKTYVVDIDALTAGSAPDAFAGDADAVLRIRITNTSPSQSLGSANVTVPAPFAAPGGPLLEFRNLSLAPGGTVDLAATVEVRTCIPTTPALFGINAKQSNDYNGNGNDFFVQPSDLQVAAVGTCGLAWVNQPTDAERLTAITSVAFDPAAAPITAEVLDASGTARATGSSASVSLSASNLSIAGPTLSGTTTAIAVAGLASFSPGPALTPSAFGYRLTATSPGLLPSLPSQAFDVVDDQVNCPAGQPCSQPASSTKAGNTVTASFGTGSTGSNLLVSLDAADAPTFACAQYPRPAGTYVSQFLFTGDDGADRTGTMSVTIPNASKPLNSYQACWAAPYGFLTAAGTPATAQGTKPGTTLPLYVGLLPDCAKRGTVVLPCVSARTFDRATRSVTVTVRATGEDPWRY